MKRLTLPSVTTALALMALASPTLGAPQSFNIDPAHSQVGFSIRHFFTRVSGRFNDYSGAVMLDEKNLENSSVEATIKATTIFTNNERRDADLRSSKFFWTDSFPTIRFKSTKVVPGPTGTLKVAGELTMRGVTKPVVLDCNFLGAGATDMGGFSMGYRAGFEASTSVNRKDYGILWNKTLDQGGTMLGDDVTISITVEAVRQEPGKAGAAAAGEK